jgi:hypothetical protein
MNSQLSDITKDRLMDASALPPDKPGTDENEQSAGPSTDEGQVSEGTDESELPEGPSRARYNFFVREALEETQRGGDLYRAMIFGTLANAEASALIAMDTETLGGLDYYRGLLEGFHSTSRPAE